MQLLQVLANSQICEYLWKQELIQEKKQDRSSALLEGDPCSVRNFCSPIDRKDFTRASNTIFPTLWSYVAPQEWAREQSSNPGVEHSCLFFVGHGARDFGKVFPCSLKAVMEADKCIEEHQASPHAPVGMLINSLCFSLSYAGHSIMQGTE